MDVCLCMTESLGSTLDTNTLNGHGFGWTPGVGDGQGGLACCGSWGRKESDMTERVNWTELTLTQHCTSAMCVCSVSHV